MGELSNMISLHMGLLRLQRRLYQVGIGNIRIMNITFESIKLESISVNDLCISHKILHIVGVESCYPHQLVFLSLALR